MRRTNLLKQYPLLSYFGLAYALTWAATLLGVAVPLNLLYFLGGLAALLICVQFSVEFVAARGAHPPPGAGPHRAGVPQPGYVPSDGSAFFRLVGDIVIVADAVCG